MDNATIAETLTVLAQLTDIHGGDGFRSKSYAAAAFAIEKLTIPLEGLPPDEWTRIRGIGASSAKKIGELIRTGKIPELEQLLQQTPPGVVEMLSIKGIGPKKIHTIWKEMGVESIGELLYACRENRLTLYKGFGEKTQQKVIESIEYYERHKGQLLFADAEVLAQEWLSLLCQLCPSYRTAITGDVYQEKETLSTIDLITDAPESVVLPALAATGIFTCADSTSTPLVFQSTFGVPLRIFLADSSCFWQRLVETSSAPDWWEAFSASTPHPDPNINSEPDLFRHHPAGWIPAYLREHTESLTDSTYWNPEALIRPEDIRGLIHCHTTWSDGSHTLREMAEAAQTAGLEYMVVSDHSRSAFYAQGLSVERIRQQHQEIEMLNNKMAPFRIFKSIECDILSDGSLDYEDEVLDTFDLVIASIHSPLQMDLEKAMSRLLRAIAHPRTTILGHPTGRLLLSRPGYPVDHERLVAACAEQGVAIELNAHPRRLDLDRRFIRMAVESGVWISINPDAHHTGGIADTRYGVLSARKGGLRASQNLSSMNLAAFESYLAARRQR